VLSFSAPSTQSIDDCPPKETTATTIASTPSTTTTVPAVTTTSIAATTTTIATQSELKIVFLGQIRRDGASSFGPLLAGNVIFCPEDNADIPLCVTFSVALPQQPDDFETRNLRIADEWQLISLSCNNARLYDRSVTFAEAFNKSVSAIAEKGVGSGLTTRPLTNSDTVYVVADDEGC
jgi:hypothetical protein